jgi:uncharacterized membrane protein YfcA
MNLDSIAVLMVATIAGVIASISGFGIGAILTPLLALRMDLQLAVAVAAISIPHVIGTAYRFALIKQSLNWPVFVSFGIWSAIGGFVGGLLGTTLRDRTLIVVLAVLLIFAGATGVLGLTEKMRFPRHLGWIAGLVSGVFSGLVGNQSGLRTAALMGFSLSKLEFVATATGVALLLDAARIPVYLFYRFDDLLKIWFPISIATIGVLVGTWVGQLLLHRIPERNFKRVVSVVVLVLGLSLLFRRS